MKCQIRYLSLHCSCVNLRAVVGAVITECQVHHANRAIQVDNQITTDLLMAYVDEAKITTVLYNVVTNAFKFTDKGFIRISSIITDTQIAIEIADSGVGIDEKHLGTIFSSFEQVATSGVRQKNGTGLGLAVCKYLVELHDGTLSVRSTLGVGSVFTVLLPRASAQQIEEYQAQHQIRPIPTALVVGTAAAKTEQVVAPVNSRLPVFYPKGHDANSSVGLLTALLVDDEPVNRMVLRLALTRRNYIVYEAVNGKEAVDVMEQGLACDVVLLDVMMPVMSGIEACQKIRSKFSAQQLPIIFVTAKTQPQDREECLLAGGNAFISKPIVAQELVAAMEQMLARKIA